jgi:hypothetical protein
MVAIRSRMFRSLFGQPFLKKQKKMTLLISAISGTTAWFGADGRLSRHGQVLEHGRVFDGQEYKEAKELKDNFPKLAGSNFYNARAL